MNDDVLGHYKKLLEAAKKYKVPPREKTFFDTAIRKHYENPTTELLSYFLNPENDHGLGSVFFDGLTDAVNALNPSVEADDYGSAKKISTEVPTASGSRIDLLIESDKAIFLIECKVKHIQNNPFTDYETHIADKFAELKPFKIVFCIDGKTNVEGWSGLAFSVYAEYVRTYLSQVMLKNPYNKWGLFAREFLMHLEHFGEKRMNDQEYNFVQNSYKDISALIQLKEDFLNETASLINTKLETSIESYEPYSRSYTWGTDQQKYDAIDFSSDQWKQTNSSAVLSFFIDTCPLKCSIYLFLHHPTDDLINKIKESLNINILQASNYNEFLKKKAEWWLGWENIPFEIDEISNKILEISKILHKVETVWRNAKVQKV
ncbi:PD-(D/E)XK nuclease family protein [Acinetobacter sp. WY4]|uniref:PD-(D/E)XK nuclease family protein n=1 Tax=Acinetobacter sp. WY4 TaxID=2708348 RepID=UPI001BCE6EFE|nr:PD-(D/E)XK nuclease family protein [Acinetobacter sp. WY4]